MKLIDKFKDLKVQEKILELDICIEWLLIQEKAILLKFFKEYL
jgi:hypothetical protein